MKTCPCLKCAESGCGKKHDTCEKYIEWKRGVDEERTTKQRNSVYDDYTWDKDMRYIRRHRQ